MKPFKPSTIALLFILLQFHANAQYQVNRFTVSPGKNPGGLKNDFTYSHNIIGFVADPGWSAITFPNVSGGNNNSWSLPVTLPFPFNFNGSPVTDFKVHRAGVVTFDIATSSIPSSTLSALPAASIPDKSILIWGWNIYGSTSFVIQHKVYGSAPNRQLWIYYKNANVPNSDNGHLWSIVLEETSDKIYIVNEYGRIHNNSLPVVTGIQVDALNAYTVSPANVTACATKFQISAEDNEYFEFTYGTPPVSDVSVYAVRYPEYKMINTPADVKYSIINKGSNTLTDVTLKYSFQGTIYSDAKSGLSLAPGESAELIHATPLALSQTNKKELKAWCEAAGDMVANNDTASTMVSGLSFIPVKKVLYECTNATWCSFNDLGFAYSDSIYNRFPTSAEIINIQETPAITDVTYVNGLLNLHWAFPDGFIDRKYVGTLYTENFSLIPQRYAEPTPCDITTQATFNPVTRDMTISLSSHFAASLIGDFRFNAAIVEEDADMDFTTHDRSAHIALAGFDGQANSVPFLINDGETHSYNFTYNIPVGWDISKIRVVGWISDASTSLVLNTAGADVITDVETLSSYGFDAQIIGNPVTVSSLMKITLEKDANVAVQIFDSNGKLCFNEMPKQLSAGTYYSLLFSDCTTSGIYIARIRVNGNSVSRKFIVE